MAARCFVVEDHDDARELVASVLGAAGAEVISVTSTQEALDCLDGTMPDLLLADLGLPGEDGYTLLRRIRAMKTSETDASARRRPHGVRKGIGSRTGARSRIPGYVVKPVDPAE